MNPTGSLVDLSSCFPGVATVGLDVEELLLCDDGAANAPYIQVTLYDAAGANVGTTTVETDGVTPYVVVGNGVPCSTSGAAFEVEVQLLCDAGAADAPYLLICQIDTATGTVTGCITTELDGVTPYVVVGPSEACGATAGITAAVEILCDDNGAFQRLKVLQDAPPAILAVADFDLNAAPYVTVGPVTNCGGEASPQLENCGDCYPLLASDPAISDGFWASPAPDFQVRVNDLGAGNYDVTFRNNDGAAFPVGNPYCGVNTPADMTDNTAFVVRLERPPVDAYGNGEVTYMVIPGWMTDAFSGSFPPSEFTLSINSGSGWVGFKESLDPDYVCDAQEVNDLLVSQLDEWVTAFGNNTFSFNLVSADAFCIEPDAHRVLLVKVCNALDVASDQVNIVCYQDDNGDTFYRAFVQDDAGTVTTADFDETGAPFTPVGAVVQCDSLQDQSEVLCDLGTTPATPFLRVYEWNKENTPGGARVVEDFELDGVTPYVPVGAVGACDLTAIECGDCFSTTGGSAATVSPAPSTATTTFQLDNLGGGPDWRIIIEDLFAVGATVDPCGFTVPDLASNEALVITLDYLGVPFTLTIPWWTVTSALYNGGNFGWTLEFETDATAVANADAANPAWLCGDSHQASADLLNAQFQLLFDAGVIGGSPTLPGEAFISDARCHNLPDAIPEPALNVKVCNNLDVDLTDGVTSFLLCDDSPGVGVPDVQFIRTFIVESGVLVSSDDTDLGGAPYAPVGTVRKCASEDYLEFMLCDSNNTQFVRAYRVDSNGVIVQVLSYDLTGVAFVPVGAVSVCQPNGLQGMWLCDYSVTPVPSQFIRWFELDNGAVLNSYDTDIDGTPIATVPTINIGQCPEQPFESHYEVFCDDNGTFMRQYQHVGINTPFFVLDTELDGSTNYLVSGAVRRCSEVRCDCPRVKSAISGPATQDPAVGSVPMEVEVIQPGAGLWQVIVTDTVTPANNQFLLDAEACLSDPEQFLSLTVIEIATGEYHDLIIPGWWVTGTTILAGQLTIDLTVNFTFPGAGCFFDVGYTDDQLSIYLADHPGVSVPALVAASCTSVSATEATLVKPAASYRVVTRNDLVAGTGTRDSLPNTRSITYLIIDGGGPGVETQIQDSSGGLVSYGNAGPVPLPVALTWEVDGPDDEGLGQMRLIHNDPAAVTLVIETRRV